MDLNILLVLAGFIIITGLVVFGIRFLKRKYGVSNIDISNELEFSLYVAKIIKGLVGKYVDENNKDGRLDSKKIKQYMNIVVETIEYFQSIPNEMSEDEKIKEAKDVIDMICKFESIEVDEFEKDIINYVLETIIKYYPEFIE